MIEDWAAEAERGYDVVSEIHLVVQGNVLGIIDIISAHEDRAEALEEANKMSIQVLYRPVMPAG